MSLFLLVVSRVFLRDVRYHDLCRSGFLLSAVASVACGLARPESKHLFNMVKRIVYRMSVILVPERDRADNDAAVAPGD